jgi:hypothetical protein
MKETLKSFFLLHFSELCIRSLFRDLGGLHGCQMAHFETKNPNLGKFWRVLQWTMLVYFIVMVNFIAFFDFVAIWDIFWLFGVFLTVLVWCTETNLATLVDLSFVEDV